MEQPQETFDAQRDPRMHFAVNWFINATEGRRRHPRESTEQLWNRVLEPMQPRPTRICETGVCESRSALWFMQHLQPELYVGIDPWIPDRRWHAQQYVEWKANCWHNLETFSGAPLQEQSANAYRTQAGPTDCWIITEPSDIYLRTNIDKFFPGQPFDLVYVDGGHDTLCAMLDMILLWKKLQVGGLMIVDDTDRRWHNARPSVLEATKAFWNLIEHCGKRLCITDATKGDELNKRQWWIRKFHE